MAIESPILLVWIISLMDRLSGYGEKRIIVIISALKAQELTMPVLSQSRLELWLIGTIIAEPLNISAQIQASIQ